MTMRGAHYVGARPLLNHDPHRYSYQVTALQEAIVPDGLKKIDANLEQIAERIQGKVVV